MSIEMKEPGEKNEKRMHVEIIKVSSNNTESCSSSLGNGMDMEDELLVEDPSETDLLDSKMNSNHNHEIPASARVKQPFVNGLNHVPNKEIFSKDSQNIKEKDCNQNGSQILTNSKTPKPKEYKFVKNIGRWVCKDTKEIKNEGRELTNEMKAPLPSNGKVSNHPPNPLTMNKPPTHVPMPVPTLDFPEINLKPPPNEPHSSTAPKNREPNPKLANLLQNTHEPLEVRMYVAFDESWDSYKQGLIQSLSAMYQQETQNLTDRISQLIGLLTALQVENTQLRAELDKYKAKQPPSN